MIAFAHCIIRKKMFLVYIVCTILNIINIVIKEIVMVLLLKLNIFAAGIFTHNSMEERKKGLSDIFTRIGLYVSDVRETILNK